MEIQPVGQLDSGAGIEAQVAIGGLKSIDGKVSSAEAARQFEAILLRQMLEESLGKAFSKGSGGHVYGYMITDALADGISKGGGLGLARVIESQLTEHRSIGPRVHPGSGVSMSTAEVEAAVGAFKRLSKISEVEVQAEADGRNE
jgi:flagellar protein FlgJ